MVDKFGTIEMDLDQLGTTTEPVKMVAVAYVPGTMRTLVSTRNAVEQWGRSLVGVARFQLQPPQVIVFCNRCETDPESRGAAGVGKKNGSGEENRDDGRVGALHRCETEPESTSGVGFGGESARDNRGTRCVLAHPCEEMTQKKVQVTGIVTTGQWGFFEARQTVQ